MSFPISIITIAFCILAIIALIAVLSTCKTRTSNSTGVYINCEDKVVIGPFLYVQIAHGWIRAKMMDGTVVGLGTDRFIEWKRTRCTAYSEWKVLSAIEVEHDQKLSSLIQEF